VGELRLRDVRVSRVDRVICELRDRSGPGTAKHAKVVLSGLLGLAVRYDAIDSNPVRELSDRPVAHELQGEHAHDQTPGWVIELLRRRHDESAGPWVFPSTRGTLRDPDNTRKQLREVVGDSVWEGLHPHAFRHLVATRLDAKGLSAREIADYLGHERVSMTQDVYLARGTTGAAAAAAMDMLAPSESDG
jgi:site-specific recombinase XerC